MKMESEMKELKSVLRSLVVSSPTEVDLRTLLRDYRNMMGEPIPLAKFGYRNGLAFIKEQCGDCFVVQGSSCNPVLTLIVPDAVKHIDKFVQKQKASPITRFKGKRRSVPEAAFKNNDLIVNTFRTKTSNLQKTDYRVVKEDEQHNDTCIDKHVATDSNRNELRNGVCRSEQDSADRTDALQNFMKKRMPLLNTCQDMHSELRLDKDSSRGDADSGRQSSSSNCSSKRAQLEELKLEVRELIAGVPEGVWCTELMRLYREKYGRELNFSRFGFTSVLSLAYAVEELQYCVAQHTGELLLRDPAAAVPAAPSAPPAALPVRPARPARSDHVAGDPEDALPGIDFDEDVFPRDCMHIMQSIPAQSLEELAPGAMLQVVLGEVYSPTHFWLLRLGPAHYSAMESLMDEMNAYYRGEGRERALAAGALRVGHYCACSYLGDWHRAVVVRLVDSDTVKVRHVDYATVESVSARALKPLLRRWAALPAQALRARLAGVRPPAAGRRWPWAAAAHFLALVRERRLVANVVAKDDQEGILEVLLIDTSTDEDVCVGTEMCRSGHADPRPDSALGTSECYLYPRFDALETGDTPNYAEIYCYLRDGISLEFVEDYRRHVPPCLPPPDPLPPREPPANLAILARRPVPSLPSRGSSPSSREPTPPPSTPPSTPPPLPEASSARPTIAAARSLSQLADRPSATRVERATSVDPSEEIDSEVKSVSVVNRIPLLRPESSAGPRPQISRSLPTGGFPALAFRHPYPSMHLSPLAPPFYPQSFAPAPPPPPYFLPGPFPVFFPEQPRFHPGSARVPQAPPGLGPAPVPQAPPGGISVPASECEIFAILSRVDPPAAHRYMVDALSRAMAGTRVTPAAPAPVPSPLARSTPAP